MVFDVGSRVSADLYEGLDVICNVGGSLAKSKHVIIFDRPYICRPNFFHYMHFVPNISNTQPL